LAGLQSRLFLISTFRTNLRFLIPNIRGLPTLRIRLALPTNSRQLVHCPDMPEQSHVPPPTRLQRLRHRMIADWRGVADGPVVSRPIREVAQLVGTVAKESGVKDRLLLEDVVSAWRSIVGDFLATSSHPDAIHRGVLVVKILQPAVHHALMMEKPRILSRLKKHLGPASIRDLRFRHG
jgi:hypothetical protein